MTNTLTSDARATAEQINRLAAAGCAYSQVCGAGYGGRGGGKVYKREHGYTACGGYPILITGSRSDVWRTG